MKFYLLFLIIFAVLSFSCDGDSNEDAVMPEMPEPVLKCSTHENLLASDCPAVELVDICEQFFRGATLDPPPVGEIPLAIDFYFPNLETPCTVINCNEIVCSEFRYTILSVHEKQSGGVGIRGLLENETEFICWEN